MKALQSTEERMLVLVLISIVVLFVCCTTPAAVLSVLYSVKLDDHLGFQVGKWLDTTFEMLPVLVYQGVVEYTLIHKMAQKQQVRPRPLRQNFFHRRNQWIVKLGF